MGVIAGIKKQIQILGNNLNLNKDNSIDKELIDSQINDLKITLSEEQKSYDDSVIYLQNPVPLESELEEKTWTWHFKKASANIQTQTHLLTNWGTWSAAEIFAMIWHAGKIGKIIGEPTGNGCNIFTDNSLVKLPTSNADLRFSLNHQSWADIKMSELPPHEVPVDVELYQSVDDYLEGIDSIAKEVYGIETFPSK